MKLLVCLMGMIGLVGWQLRAQASTDYFSDELNVPALDRGWPASDDKPVSTLTLGKYQSGNNWWVEPLSLSLWAEQSMLQAARRYKSGQVVRFSTVLTAPAQPTENTFIGEATLQVALGPCVCPQPMHIEIKAFQDATGKPLLYIAESGPQGVGCYVNPHGGAGECVLNNYGTYYHELPYRLVP